MRGQAWRESECRLLVADYFQMLKLELQGSPFNKAARSRELRQVLDGREHGSIERKRQNVSAVLKDMGLPFVDGYKPLGHYQELLAESVRSELDARTDLLELLKSLDSGESYSEASWLQWARTVPIVAPLVGVVRERHAGPATWVRATPKYDFVTRNIANHALGRRGEQFVLEMERSRLARAGRLDLADKVEWTSEARGDGFGYDLQSFEPNGVGIFIEVKTTSYNGRTPFLVTRNEVETSSLMGADFRLYRLFTFLTAPRCFILPGPMRRSCELDPTEYRGRVLGA